MLFISLLDLRLAPGIGSEGLGLFARGSPFSTSSLISTSLTEHSLVAFVDVLPLPPTLRFCSAFSLSLKTVMSSVASSLVVVFPPKNFSYSSLNAFGDDDVTMSLSTSIMSSLCVGALLLDAPVDGLSSAEDLTEQSVKK